MQPVLLTWIFLHISDASPMGRIDCTAGKPCQIRGFGAMGVLDDHCAIGSALASRLGRHQQFVFRYEFGERGLNVVELVDVVRSLGIEAGNPIKQLL
jgi:hypothetical protein